VSLKKSIVGLTFIRDSDIRHDYFTKTRTSTAADRVLPQPGPRGVDADRQQRARLSEAGAAVVEERGHGHHGGKTPQAAMDNLAEEMDQVMARLQRPA
jgi:glycerol transport system substrate-binding protein